MIISRYTGELPLARGSDRKISGGPLYSREDVQAILEAHGTKAIKSWTEKCAKDLQKWSLDADDLNELVETALSHGRFRGTEWCMQRPGGPWAACDVYVVRRIEWIPHARKEMDVEYYIKFAIARTGVVLFLVSCHPHEDRR